MSGNKRLDPPVNGDHQRCREEKKEAAAEKLAVCAERKGRHFRWGPLSEQKPWGRDNEQQSVRRSPDGQRSLRVKLGLALPLGSRGSGDTETLSLCTLHVYHEAPGRPLLPQPFRVLDLTSLGPVSPALGGPTPSKQNFRERGAEALGGRKQEPVAQTLSSGL